jgi:type II secretory pathway pseudopilin PulG
MHFYILTLVVFTMLVAILLGLALPVLLSMLDDKNYRKQLANRCRNYRRQTQQEAPQNEHKTPTIAEKLADVLSEKDSTQFVLDVIKTMTLTVHFHDENGGYFTILLDGNGYTLSGQYTNTTFPTGLTQIELSGQQTIEVVERYNLEAFGAINE